MTAMPLSPQGQSQVASALFLSGIYPVAALAPQMSRYGRRIRFPEVERALAGLPHGPVVYFARIGRDVKIGTTTNLRQRMLAMYLDLEDVLAVVPGDRQIEARYHEVFGPSRRHSPGRMELFRMDLLLRLFLARCWCRASTLMQAAGYSGSAAVVVEHYAGIPAGILGGLALLAAIILPSFMRPGWRMTPALGVRSNES